MVEKKPIKVPSKSYADKFGALVPITDTAGIEVMEVLVKANLEFAWYFNAGTKRYIPSFSLVGVDDMKLMEDLTSWGIRFTRLENKPNPDVLLVSLGSLSIPHAVVPC